LPVHRIGVSVPPELLEEFDRSMREMGFKDRSKAIQAAMRGFISDFSKRRRVRVNDNPIV
jgi:metal-responsive CopG/Arc/MetJ family transcriptional regulator